MPAYFQHALLRWKPINDCLLVACFRCKLGQFLTIIIYVPTDGAEDHTKDKLYNKFKYILNSLSQNKLFLILIDMNATVSSSAHHPNIMPHITGTVFADLVINDNGECLLLLCHCDDCCLADTYISCKCVHQWTW